MNKLRSVNRYVGLSIILHTLICVCLFLAVIHKQLPLATHIKPLIAPENIPAPVIFAQQPATPKPVDTSPLDIDPPGMPGGLAISMSKLPDESLLANKKPGLKQDKEQPVPTIKQEGAKINPVASSLRHPGSAQGSAEARGSGGQATQQPVTPQMEHAATTMQQELPKPLERSTQAQVINNSTDKGIPIQKELTLADLFKNAQKSFAQEETVVAAQDAGGPSGDIVISEGSLKYYSLWSKFLSHLNDAARFNRRGGIDAQVHQWLQAGLIKKEALFAIDIDKKGQVVNVALLSSSGHTPFDKLCITDIWSAAPYPPLPDSINRPTARFQVKAFF